MKWILRACLILALLPSAALAADCDNNRAVWSSEWKAKDGEPFWRLTFPEGASRSREPVQFEIWMGGQKAGVVAGTYECFGTAVWCGVSLKSNSEAEPHIGAIVEWIDEERDRTSEWIVIAGLPESGKQGNGPKIEWQPGFTQPKELITPPNVYKFAGCRQP